MSFTRIRSLILHELFVTKRTFEIFVDTFCFPILNMVLFGLITHYVGSENGGVTAHALILGVLLWEIVVINQYNMTISSLWNIWSHNLTNIFIAPISIGEYLTAHILASLIRTLAVIGFLVLSTYWLFGFNLLHIGVVNVLLAFVNLSLFAWWIGIMLLGIIFRYGMDIQAISWGTIYAFQPLTASFFPVSILPGWLQWVSYTQPATYVFEAGRAALTHPGIQLRFMLIALVMNIGYTVVAIIVFKRLFDRSRTAGQFARNDL